MSSYTHVTGYSIQGLNLVFGSYYILTSSKQQCSLLVKGPACSRGLNAVLWHTDELKWHCSDLAEQTHFKAPEYTVNIFL